MELNVWFECTVAIDQMQEDGITKAVTQKYLVDALSFKEAEDRIIEEVAPFTSGNLDVKAVKRVRVSELFENTSGVADKWYRIKIVLVTIDEKTCKEKETPNVIMVQSASFADALADFNNGMKGSMMDYRIVSITETKILDVFKYVKGE